MSFKVKKKRFAAQKIINYKDIFEASGLFVSLPNNFNKEWIHAKKFVDWANLGLLSDKEIMNRVVKFLNQWSSHIKKDINVVKGIKSAHQESKIYIDALLNENLWDLDLSKRIMVQGTPSETSDVIYRVFKRFRDIGYHLREVATSKLLHHIQPNLFIMWDNKIMNAYGVKKTPEDYVYTFMPYMKDKANEVINSYVKDFGVSREEALEKLNAYKTHKTLVKLLDEYNWIQYTSFGKTN